ncbi:hypothetical protein QFC19_001233 [Naganishia cerealis]|uniref:Uncharacterized protein n=1 Tax=Naganishia cerealis TaxID=610337 RepID=A0ACC2WJX2_9TREE|nr:hypothetical protein QFC19_001233 [Naganishia cerealis]
MPPVKVKHHHKHSQKQQRPPPAVVPSDVSETVNEIQDGLRVLFADSVKKVKGVADGQVGVNMSAEKRSSDFLLLSPHPHPPMHSVETHYITPLANTVGSFASGNPVIFSPNAAINPVGDILFNRSLSFRYSGIATFLISMLLGALLVVLLTVSAGILLVAAFTAFTSFLATSSLVGLFLTTRLYLCIKKAGLSNVSEGILEWIEETRLRLFLGLGLASEGRSSASYRGLPDPQEETLVVAHVISSTATNNRETKERQEADEKTQVGHQDHSPPSQVMLELVEVHGGSSSNNNVKAAPPTPDVSFLQDRIDINIVPAHSSTISTDRIQASPPRSADTDD